MAYREDVFLQYMIDHYRNRFTDCHIVLYDNESPDKTREIALANNCEVLDFKTGGKIDDFKIRDLKNNCWKNAKTDWVLVCDVDELLNINAQELANEEKLGTTVIRSEGWNMVNMENNYDFANIKHGTRVPQYDKSYLFNKKFISNINYHCGGHNASPVGAIKHSAAPYKLWHYKCINPDYLVERFRWTAERLSDANKKANMGTYWLESSEEKIRAGYDGGKNNAIKVIP